MAGKLLNIQACSPLKLQRFDRKVPRNLPLLIKFTVEIAKLIQDELSWDATILQSQDELASMTKRSLEGI